MFNHLSTCWNFHVFSSERKFAPIYTIFARSILHIYTVGLYKYTFHQFSATSPPVRMHTLCCPCAHPIVECLKKLRWPCAHGWQHVCTRISRFQYSGLCSLYIYAKKHPLQCILLWWNGDEIELRDLLPTDVKKEEYNMVWNSGIIAAVFCLRSCYNSLITCWSRSK